GEALDRRGEVDLLLLHDEADDVALRLAAEAVVDVHLRVDREGRGLLGVEGAQPRPLPPGPSQRGVLADDLHDVGRRPDRGDVLGVGAHRRRRLPVATGGAGWAPAPGVGGRGSRRSVGAPAGPALARPRGLAAPELRPHLGLQLGLDRLGFGLHLVRDRLHLGLRPLDLPDGPDRVLDGLLRVHAHGGADAGDLLLEAADLLPVRRQVLAPVAAQALVGAVALVPVVRAAPAPWRAATPVPRRPGPGETA